MSPLLIIEWEGATFDVLRPWIVARELPNLASLIEAGAHGTLRGAQIAKRSADVWQPLLSAGPLGAGRRVLFVSGDSHESVTAAQRHIQGGAWDCIKIAYHQRQSVQPHDSLLALYQERDRQLAELTPLLPRDATLLLLSLPTRVEFGLADNEDHASDGGMFLACGALIRAGIEVGGGSIDDVAQTALRLLDISPPPAGQEGRVLEELFATDHSVVNESIDQNIDERIVAERLRSLGYIE